MSLLQQAPRFDAATAAHVARTLYALQAVAHPLPSERDQNFRLDTPDGRFVLKIANATESRTLLEAQSAAMAHVSALGLSPTVLPSIDGALITELPGPHLVRLLTWQPGVTFASMRRHGASLLEDFGRRLGEFDRALSTFDHPAIHRRFHWDLATGVDTIREHASLIAVPEVRRAVERCAGLIADQHATRLDRLPRATVHNDPNDYNVLVDRAELWDDPPPRISGFIDFGDMLHSYAMADVAVAIAYAVLRKAQPLDAALPIVRGYHQQRALDDEEIAALWPLVQLRLCVSAAVAAWQQRQRPEDGYLAISQDAIRQTLPALDRVHSRFAEAAFRHACGLEPRRDRAAVVSWIRAAGPAPVLPNLNARRTAVVDLSVASSLLDGDPASNVEQSLTTRIVEHVKTAGADVGIGRYLEPRALYSSTLFEEPGEAGRRTIHLGVDLFVPPATAVCAPLDGIVHAVADNRAPLDYGLVVILRHETPDGVAFFTLFGHLTRESLANLRVGQRIARGDVFAAIGHADVNGGWTPHLHLQLLLDLFDAGVNVPGVCRAAERDVWAGISPDPGVLAGLGPSASFDSGVESDTALNRRSLGTNLSVSYREPLALVRGWMQRVYDSSGRAYLDAYNNVPHVGHSHPRVIEAAARQWRTLNTNTRYLHPLLERFAERLTGTLPAPLRVCYFVNSGSEANELALRLARAHTGRRDTIVLDAAYHGNTTTLIDISPYKFDGPGGTGAPPWVHVVPQPDTYRGPYRRNDPDAGAHYAAFVASAIDRMIAEGTAPAAFIAETCPSVGGQLLLPPGYLEAAYRYVRQAGGVCIADEVQTAYGRMGSHFYAFEAHGVVPDIVVLGKPIGNGYPLGAIVTTPDVARSFANGMEFFSTFGGSTVSCAVGLAVLDVVEQERLQQHARDVGDHLLDGLRPFLDRHSVVGDVRGSGLFIGVELVSDRASLSPAAAQASYVINRMKEQGCLIGTDGPFHNVLKIRPPMPFDRADADRLIHTLDEVLDEVDS